MVVGQHAMGSKMAVGRSFSRWSFRHHSFGRIHLVHVGINPGWVAISQILGWGNSEGSRGLHIIPYNVHVRTMTWEQFSKCMVTFSELERFVYILNKNIPGIMCCRPYKVITCLCLLKFLNTRSPFFKPAPTIPQFSKQIDATDLVVPLNRFITHFILQRSKTSKNLVQATK